MINILDDLLGNGSLPFLQTLEAFSSILVALDKLLDRTALFLCALILLVGALPLLSHVSLEVRNLGFGGGTASIELLLQFME